MLDRLLPLYLVVCMTDKGDSINKLKVYRKLKEAKAAVAAKPRNKFGNLFAPWKIIEIKSLEEWTEVKVDEEEKAMTVQELINKLSEVENKELPIVSVISTGMDCDDIVPFVEEGIVFEIDIEERCVSLMDKRVSKWIKTLEEDAE